MAVGSGDLNGPDRLDILAAHFWQSDGNAEAFLTFLNDRRFLAADGCLDDFVDVGDVNTVAGDLGPVDIDLDLG